MQSLEHVELELIGSIFVFEHKIDHIFSKIKDQSYFYFLTNKIVYSAMVALRKVNKPITYATVSEYLRVNSLLEDIGGYSAILKYADFAVVSSAQIDYLIDFILFEKSKNDAFKLADELIKSIQESFTGEQVTENINNHISRLFELSRGNDTSKLQHISDVIKEIDKEHDRLKKGEQIENKYIPTGFSGIDSLLGGGLNPEEDFIIIAARPAMGKSGFVKDIALNITKAITLPLLYVTLEMSNTSTANRMIVSESEVDSFRLKSGYKVDWDRVDSVKKDLAGRNIFMYDSGSLTYPQLVSFKNEIEAKTGQKLGALIIDYLQLMGTDDASENRVQELSKISRSLKKFNQAFKIPVIALSQLSRSVEQRQDKRPQLSDLRESGSLEQDASQVWFVYRPAYYNPETDRSRVADIIIAKSRNSPIGTIELYYDSTLVKFSSLEK